MIIRKQNVDGLLIDVYLLIFPTTCQTSKLLWKCIILHPILAQNNKHRKVVGTMSGKLKCPNSQRALDYTNKAQYYISSYFLKTIIFRPCHLCFPSRSFQSHCSYIILFYFAHFVLLWIDLITLKMLLITGTQTPMQCWKTTFLSPKALPPKRHGLAD